MVYEPPAIYGIIGNPVEHSLSPVMHNTAFKALKVNAVYKLFPLADEEELKLFFEDLKEEGNPIFGLNVTVPYKEKVVPYLDTIDPFAEKVGAVNTLVIDHKHKIRGFNTDGPGFLIHLRELGFDPKGKRIAVLGAGGTARSILTVLCVLKERPHSILLYNRTLANTRDLFEDLSGRINTDIVRVVEDIEDLNIELADLLINTSTLGMDPNDPQVIDPRRFHANMLVYDVVYAPAETKLLKEAKVHGAKTANGLGMLFYQGVLAFQHWADVEVDERVKRAMRKALEEKVNS